MRFGAPLAFWGLLVVPVVIAALIWSEALLARRRRSLGREGALRRQFSPLSGGKLLASRILLVTGLTLLALSLVRPQMGGRSVMVNREGVDLLILLDVSRSMTARDTRPSRLERSKLELSRLMDVLKGDRVGIVIFSGKAFVQCPLTTDYAAAKVFLRSVQAGDIPAPGTSLAAAFDTAATVLTSGQSRAKSRVLVVVTDGEDFDKETNARIAKLKEMDVRVYTVGVGSAAGEPIPVDAEGGGYLKDQGRTVMSRRNDDLLKSIADATHGAYYNLQEGGDLTMLVEDIGKLQKETFKSELYTQYDEQFVIPLAAALLAIVLGWLLDERRGSRLGLAGLLTRRDRNGEIT